MTFVNEWVEKGRVEGLTIGRQEGLSKGRLAIVCRLLTRRFGEISPQLQQQIDHLSDSSLDDLAEALLDFKNISDAQTWIATT